MKFMFCRRIRWSQRGAKDGFSDSSFEEFTSAPLKTNSSL